MPHTSNLPIITLFTFSFLILLMPSLSSWFLYKTSNLIKLNPFHQKNTSWFW